MRVPGSRNAIVLTPSFQVRLNTRYKLPYSFPDPSQLGDNVTRSSIAITFPIVFTVQENHQSMHFAMLIGSAQ